LFGAACCTIYFCTKTGFEYKIFRLERNYRKSVAKGICWDQLQIGIEAIQLQLGTVEFPFNSEYSSLSHLIPASWYTGVWKFCDELDIIFRGWKSTIPMQRINDSEIMLSFSKQGYSKATMEILNNCRQYLQVITISELMQFFWKEREINIVDHHIYGLKSENHISHHGRNGKRQ